jgi:hypothetical protein
MKKILSIAVLIGMTLTLQAQDLQSTLSTLSSSSAQAYVNPVVSAFGSNLNSGWVSQFPSSALLALHLDVKVIAAASFFSDNQKNFSTDGTFYFTNSQIDQILQHSGYTPNQIFYNDLKKQIQSTQFSVNFSGPTIIGSKNDSLHVQFPGKTVQSNGQQYTIAPYKVAIKEVNGYLDGLKGLPMPAAQLTVGTVYGTNVSFRYFPEIDIKNLGKFSLWGFGIIHNPGTWFPNPLPVDLGIGYFYQKLKVGDIFESNASQLGIYVSKTFGFGISFTPYFGLITETSKSTVTYHYQSNQTINGTPVPPVDVSFDLTGDNSGGAVLGFNIHLGLININADYKAAKTSTASAGVSFGF